jgi:hypothetical protein
MFLPEAAVFPKGVAKVSLAKEIEMVLDINDSLAPYLLEEQRKVGISHPRKKNSLFLLL